MVNVLLFIMFVECFLNSVETAVAGALCLLVLHVSSLLQRLHSIHLSWCLMMRTNTLFSVFYRIELGLDFAQQISDDHVGVFKSRCSP